MTVREQVTVVRVLAVRPEKAPYCYRVQTADGRTWASQWPDRVIDLDETT